MHTEQLGTPVNEDSESEGWGKAPDSTPLKSSYVLPKLLAQGPPSEQGEARELHAAAPTERQLLTPPC